MVNTDDPSYVAQRWQALSWEKVRKIIEVRLEQLSQVGLPEGNQFLMVLNGS